MSRRTRAVAGAGAAPAGWDWLAIPHSSGGPAEPIDDGVSKDGGGEISPWLDVESMDIDGQGVARRADGKVVFIEGALPTERVQVHILRGKKQWEQGVATRIDRESSQRVVPGCPHFGLHHGACGGCKVQHAHPALQVAVKQRVLEDNLQHLAKVRAEVWLPPIVGPAWGYRQRARWSIRYVQKRGEALVGFHERKSRYIADTRVCPVLPPDVECLLMPLRLLIGSLDARETCPQIEVAGGVDVRDPGTRVVALVLRHLQALSDADQERLRAFAREHPQVQWWLQPKGPDSAALMESGEPRRLAYELPEFGVRMPFRPTEFTQVNAQINAVLVSRALRLLDVQPGDRVIDWFCGIGNFSLPLARLAAQVVGFEGSAALVARARANFEENKVSAGTHTSWGAMDFEETDLFEWTAERLASLGKAQRWLIDPPREGAFALSKALAELVEGAGDPAQVPPDWSPPRRIVYVSCNPATLARDAGLLVHRAGYRLLSAGVVNMFPHTAHVESVAVFERP